MTIYNFLFLRTHKGVHLVIGIYEVHGACEFEYEPNFMNVLIISYMFMLNTLSKFIAIIS
jgi:hypothetical protein